MQSNTVHQVSLDENTQIEAMNILTNDSGDLILEIPKQKRKWMKPLLAASVTVCLIAIVLILVLSLTGTSTSSVTMNKNEALVVLQDLSNTTADDAAYELFEKAFGVFDENDDNYLNETEFAAYLELEVEYFSMFQKIDADNDDILSFREVVCYMNEMWQIHPVRENMIRDMSSIISSVYNFSFVGNESNIDRHSMFIEYVSMLLYFVPFDVNTNGYIHHDEYLSVIVSTEFSQIDADDNGKLDKDEFYNLLFGVDERSWKGQIIESYGDDYDEVMESLNDINITTVMVQDITLHLCSSVFGSFSSDIVRSQTRRLIYCYHWWGIVCTHLGCQWIIVYFCG